MNFIFESVFRVVVRAGATGVMKEVWTSFIYLDSLIMLEPVD